MSCRAFKGTYGFKGTSIVSGFLGPGAFFWTGLGWIGAGPGWIGTGFGWIAAGSVRVGTVFGIVGIGPVRGAAFACVWARFGAVLTLGELRGRGLAGGENAKFRGGYPLGTCWAKIIKLINTVSKIFLSSWEGHAGFRKPCSSR